MATPFMGAAMKGPMYCLRENGAQHGGHRFHLCVSTFKGSRSTMRVALVSWSHLLPFYVLFVALRCK